MKQPLTFAAATLLVVACSDNPTAPETKPVAARLAPSSAAFNQSVASMPADIGLTLDDVRDRLVPLLTDRKVADELTVLLDGVRSSLSAGDVDEARRLIGVARVTVDPNGDESAAGLGDLADLAALRLTLANLDAAVGS